MEDKNQNKTVFSFGRRLCDKNQNRTVFSFGTGLCGVLLTIAIIAIRAFQPGAEPMCEWSAWSWFLMTLPVTLPIIFFIAVGALWLIGMILVELF